MFTLLSRTIATKRLLLFSTILIAIGMNWMLVAFFPSIHRQAEQFSVMIEAYPKSFLEAFGVQGNIFLNFESFLAVENFSIMWPIILLVLIITLGSGEIAGEIEKGTIEVLLAQPLSRTKIFLGKYMAGFLVLLLFIFASVYSVVPLATIHSVELNLKGYFTIFVLGIFLTLAIYSITMMFSSIFSTKGKPAALAAGILIFMYAANLFSKLQESVENLRYLSFFHYFDYNKALIDSQIDSLAIVIFATVSFICTLIGLVVFVKRDIAT